jgi:hypothetical protein
MSNYKCRKADGLKYVTRRLQDDPTLIQTISDCHTKPTRKKKKRTKVEMEILSIYNILKSHK